MNRFKLLILTGFVISTLLATAEDYYWVGGQGFWSDLNSWRTVMGQIPSEVPDANDNVIFNENSFIAPFDTVFIMTGNPTCRSFTVQNIQDTVVFFGGSSTTTFQVYGSWTMHPKVRNEYKGKIKFTSGQMGNTITCGGAGARFPGDIWFEGTGEWILQDTLFVYDSTDWKEIIFNGVDPTQPNPLIIHNNGRLDANGQTIICRGFATTGNKAREIDIENSDCLMLGPWTLSAESLTFNAANSYIYCTGMNNFNGDVLHYNNVDFYWPDGELKNTDIMTYLNVVHFWGGGGIDGKKTEGQLGIFNIDTLIMEGAVTMSGPIPNTVSAHYNEFNYSLYKLTWAEIDGNFGNYHRVDDSCFFAPSHIAGLQNTIDSIHYFTTPKGIIRGEFEITQLALFNLEGVLSSDLEKENHANHVVMASDGWLQGNNFINKWSNIFLSNCNSF